jgi:hypothetical protein
MQPSSADHPQPKVVHLRDGEISLEDRQLIVEKALQTPDQDAEALLGNIGLRLERCASLPALFVFPSPLEQGFSVEASICLPIHSVSHWLFPPQLRWHV